VDPEAQRAQSQPRAEPGIARHTGGVFSDEQVELLAELAHDRNRMQGHQESDRAHRPYAELAEADKEANRDSVRAIPQHLAVMGYGLAVFRGEGGSCNFSAEEIDRGAQSEHERWARFTRGRGYRYGEQRDDTRRTHPDLVPWGELTDAAKEKDRERIRAIPELVAQLALLPVRRPDAEPARPDARP